MNNQKDNNECFIIMPISDCDGYEKGHFKRVYEDIIKPAVNKANFVPRRADEVKETNLIHLDILNKLIDAPIAICDLSTRNPNVLFELGIRQAFDKPVVLIQEEGTPKIFDISPLRVLNYSKEMRYHDVLESQKELTEMINATKEAEGDVNNVNSIVKLLALSYPAKIPQLDSSNKENLALDVIYSQMNDMKRMIEKFMVYTRQNTNNIDRNLFFNDYEGLCIKFDKLIKINNVKGDDIKNIYEEFSNLMESTQRMMENCENEKELRRLCVSLRLNASFIIITSFLFLPQNKNYDDKRRNSFHSSLLQR